MERLAPDRADGDLRPERELLEREVDRPPERELLEREVDRPPER